MGKLLSIAEHTQYFEWVADLFHTKLQIVGLQVTSKRGGRFASAHIPVSHEDYRVSFCAEEVQIGSFMQKMIKGSLFLGQLPSGSALVPTTSRPNTFSSRFVITEERFCSWDIQSIVGDLEEEEIVDFQVFEFLTKALEIVPLWSRLVLQAKRNSE